MFKKTALFLHDGFPYPTITTVQSDKKIVSNIITDQSDKSNRSTRWEECAVSRQPPPCPLRPPPSHPRLRFLRLTHCQPEIKDISSIKSHYRLFKSCRITAKSTVFWKNGLQEGEPEQLSQPGAQPPYYNPEFMVAILPIILNMPNCHFCQSIFLDTTEFSGCPSTPVRPRASAPSPWSRLQVCDSISIGKI